MNDDLSRRVLLDQQLPHGLLVDRVEIREIRMPAGFAAGPHVHNGPVFGTIVEGRVLFQIEDATERVLEPGDPFYEPAETVITRFDALERDVIFMAHFPLATEQTAELRFID